jgi:hypothetical protein
MDMSEVTVNSVPKQKQKAQWRKNVCSMWDKVAKFCIVIVNYGFQAGERFANQYA